MGNIEILQSIPHQIAAMAQMFGFLDETEYLYYCIREDFEKMKKEKPEKSIDDIEYDLSEKYSRAKGTIHNILYIFPRKS